MVEALNMRRDITPMASESLAENTPSMAMKYGRHQSDVCLKTISVPIRKSSRSLSVTDEVNPLAGNGPMPGVPIRPAPMQQHSQGPRPPAPSKAGTPYNESPNPLGPNGSIAAQTVSSKDPKVAAQAASDMRNVVRRKLTGYVGFANLPNQWHRKSVRKGFNFNVMVVGRFSSTPLGGC